MKQVRVRAPRRVIALEPRRYAIFGEQKVEKMRRRVVEKTFAVRATLGNGDKERRRERPGPSKLRRVMKARKRF